MTDDLLFAGAAALADDLRRGDLSSRELTGACLDRIDALNGPLNAFTNVLREEALAEAADRDAAHARGERAGPLHGVPVAIKEELDVAGQVTTFGGRANTAPARADGEVVRRLRAAGAVVIGKTNMPEFGQWPFTESVAFGHIESIDPRVLGLTGRHAAAVANRRPVADVRHGRCRQARGRRVPDGPTGPPRQGSPLRR